LNVFHLIQVKGKKWHSIVIESHPPSFQHHHASSTNTTTFNYCYFIASLLSSSHKTPPQHENIKTEKEKQNKQKVKTFERKALELLSRVHTTTSLTSITTTKATTNKINNYNKII